jgi:hypothetical protein
MLFVVSPAKNLDYQQAANTLVFSQPDFLEESKKLVEICKKKSPAKLASLMSISDKLAGLNAARFSSWTVPFTTENAKQAVLAFNGDVYLGLDAQSLSADDLDFAQQHMRILSGLYGLLRPLDLMQAYRLEMGTKLQNKRGKDLYAFWGDKITRELNAQMEAKNTEVLVNLASNEYFKSVNPKKLSGKIITPVFKDQKNGTYKVISFFAKRARGMMARYIIQHKITDPEQLKQFDLGGYQFTGCLSESDQWVFSRKEQTV